MSGDLNATTKVTVELAGRRPTIADVQTALTILTDEGIPETFDVNIIQREDREYAPEVAYADRAVTYTFSIEAERASRWPA